MKWFISLLFLLLFVPAGCQNQEISSIQDVYQGEPTRVSILDGAVGLAYATGEEELIQKMMKEINQLSLTRAEDQSSRAGYLYYVDLFENDNQQLRLVIREKEVGIDGVYYETDREIGRKIKKFYEKLAAAKTGPGFGVEDTARMATEEGEIDYELPGCNAGTYRGDFKDGLPHGTGTWSYPEGGEYSGQWKNGLFHGQGTYTWPDGKRYEGQWKEGFPHGEGTMYLNDGKKRSGTWSGGRLVQPAAPVNEEDN